jgi:hypothetical protein
MTPKEKARDLVDKFVYHVESITDWGQLNNAKECALIAVDEILKITWVDKFLTVEEYWQEVKTEINKIEL